jgi:hypothetical protein
MRIGRSAWLTPRRPAEHPPQHRERMTFSVGTSGLRHPRLENHAIDPEEVAR